MNQLLSSSKLFFKRNSSTILTCVGAAGVVATTVTAVKATPKAIRLLEDAQSEKGEELTKTEKVLTAAPAYIPTAVIGVTTIACIFGANILNKRQQATLMSAYALADRSYKDYKNKVDELYGSEAGVKVREEIAKDNYDDSIVPDSDKQLFYDFYSGRYFESTMEAVLRAEYETNRALSVNSAVCVNEYYDFLGLEPLPEYENIGWGCGSIEAMYWHTWIEFEHETTTIDGDSEEHGGLECCIIHMPLEPFMDYLEY